MYPGSYHTPVIVAFLCGVLLAGCSTMQGPANLPSGTASVDRAARGQSPGNPPYYELLKEQIDGKLPHYLPRRVLKIDYDALRRGGTVPRAHRNAGSVAIWVANQPSEFTQGYLFGITRKGKVVRTINLGDATQSSCSPTSIKVDHSQNIWINCYMGGYYPAGQFIELDPSGKFVASYFWRAPPPSCPPSYEFCYVQSAGGDDGAANGSYVFAGVNSIAQACPSNPVQCNTIYANGYEWWPANDPSATPTFVNLTGCCGSEPLNSVGYMDVDGNGDLLFDYNVANSYCQGYGVAEIRNPASASWSFVDLIPACSGPFSGATGYAAGVYVGNSGSTETLNVTGNGRSIYRWALPITSSGTYTVLGPTPANKTGLGAPVSGNFGPNDTYAVQGDAAGWVDFGTVSSNKWKKIFNVNLIGADNGAALTPSDK